MRTALLAVASVWSVWCQGLDPSALLKPAGKDWPSHNGDYSGRRFSTLTQINERNVDSLTLAWGFQAKTSVLKGTPLEVNGILYVTAPDNVWALDAATGRQIWRYQKYVEHPALSKVDAKGYMALRKWATQFYDVAPVGVPA